MATTPATGAVATQESGRSPNDGELEALLERCARRDARALESLYARTAPQLLAILLRILRRRAVAEEALQDVYVSVWERAAQYQAYRGRAMSWLASVARYRAIDLLRREARRPVLLDEETEVHEVPAESPEEGEGLTARASAALTRCLELLEPQQRRSVELAFIEGFSHGEIALRTGRPLGTVKSWVRRGLLALRECLGP